METADGVIWDGPPKRIELTPVRCVQCHLIDGVPEAQVNRWYETHRCNPKQLEISLSRAPIDRRSRRYRRVGL